MVDPRSDNSPKPDILREAVEAEVAKAERRLQSRQREAEANVKLLVDQALGGTVIERTSSSDTSPIAKIAEANTVAYEAERDRSNLFEHSPLMIVGVGVLCIAAGLWLLSPLLSPYFTFIVGGALIGVGARILSDYQLMQSERTAAKGRIHIDISPGVYEQIDQLERSQRATTRPN